MDRGKKFRADQGHGFYIIHTRFTERASGETKWNIHVKQSYDTGFTWYILLIWVDQCTFNEMYDRYDRLIDVQYD